MKKTILFLGILTFNVAVFAETEEFEPCANGGGSIITGAVNKQKYCISHNIMNWWNAVAWCDAMGKKLVPFNQEECDFASKTSPTNTCPNFFGIESPYGYRVWTSTPADADSAYRIGINHESYDTHLRGQVGGSAADITRALCKM